MKYKLLYYRLPEHLLLEDELNKLGSQGYCLNNLGLFSKFKPTSSSHTYFTVLYRKKSFFFSNSKRSNLIDIINRYEDLNNTYCGRLGKILIFEGTNKPKNLDQENNQIKKDYQFRYFSFSIVSFFFFIGVSLILNSKPELSNLLTNGSIILSYFPATLLFYFTLTSLYKLLLVINRLKKNTIFHNLLNCLLILIVVSSLFAISDDFLARKSSDTSKQEVLQLADFGYKNKKTRINIQHSLLIPYSYNYIQNNNKQVLYVRFYEIPNVNLNKKLFNHLLNKFDQKKKINSQLYLAKSNSNKYDIYLYSNQKKIIFITTSFELLASNNYQTITNYYK